MCVFSGKVAAALILAIIITHYPKRQNPFKSLLTVLFKDTTVFFIINLPVLNIKH